jgi:hypothetical protein
MSDDSDFDRVILTRDFEKSHLTPRRIGVLKEFVSRHNEENRYPYGVSPNGYRYTCGCSHDCCGCLTSDTMSLHFTRNNVVVRREQSFNYWPTFNLVLQNPHRKVGVFFVTIFGQMTGCGILSGKGVWHFQCWWEIQTKMRKDDKVDKCVLHTKNPDKFPTTRDGEVSECG